ncbi:hypothetical protein RM550_05710 [Streptomyces sp. DSM 41527]|uniref:Uncharacterized protein n=1 Tax=Streptomyces mooreae TaxID=3075523 RepID=A0ABU2T1Y0_9ACTN|nr:hypothetical protein [Streptomyces sp. DSM 41527]MDT0455237.1 hypothetical protein [Streptomyces sp. DSM 41527]
MVEQPLGGLGDISANRPGVTVGQGGTQRQRLLELRVLGRPFVQQGAQFVAAEPVEPSAQRGVACRGFLAQRGEPAGLAQCGESDRDAVLAISRCKRGRPVAVSRAPESRGAVTRRALDRWT